MRVAGYDLTKTQPVISSGHPSISPLFRSGNVNKFQHPAPAGNRSEFFYRLDRFRFDDLGQQVAVRNEQVFLPAKFQFSA